MKNMIELPTEADYHKTKIIDIPGAGSHILQKKEDTIFYKRCIINLRNIVDISEKSMVLNVIDEEKYPAYLEEVEKQKEKISEYRKQRILQPSGTPVTMPTNDEFEAQPIPLFGYERHPEPPHKEISIKGVLILYFNGAQRYVVDDYQDFQELYFNYLKFQKLDIIAGN